MRLCSCHFRRRIWWQFRIKVFNQWKVFDHSVIFSANTFYRFIVVENYFYISFVIILNMCTFIGQAALQKTLSDEISFIHFKSKQRPWTIFIATDPVALSPLIARDALQKDISKSIEDEATNLYSRTFSALTSVLILHVLEALILRLTVIFVLGVRSGLDKTTLTVYLCLDVRSGHGKTTLTVYLWIRCEIRSW